MAVRGFSLQLIVLMLVLLGCSAGVRAANAWPGSIEAVRSDWQATQPPAEGWTPVTLPDDWGRRWPEFDGVVWYRLRWSQNQASDELALLIDYWVLAAEVRINGAVLYRDPALVEPLSRSWNVPHFWRLPRTLLRIGENEVLVRVSGLSAYQAGLGGVHLGPGDELRQIHDSGRRLRFDLQILSLAVGSTLALFFLVLWLLRREQAAYGWYSAQQLAWIPVAWNQVSHSPWPFADTYHYQASVAVGTILSGGCWAMFVLRFSDRRWPRREMMIWSLIAAASLWMFLAPLVAPTQVRGAREILVFASLILYCTFDVALLVFAGRSRRTDQRVLAACTLVALIAGLHDVLLVFRLIDGATYYASIALNAILVGTAFVLAWNFVQNLRRIERFNLELQTMVDDARADLTSTLSRQHELELVHARLGERVGLAHDLHDGLGGMLIGNIAAMEQAPNQQHSSRQVLGMLKELRDDLRLIIDTASAQHYGEHSLAELLAPLRHRMTRLFEAHDIDVRWQVAGLENVYLSTSRSLDLLRVLQEALTNVLKHAGAQHVSVALERRDDELFLEVSDDGRGLAISADRGHGTGMRSMQARARRLSGTLSVSTRDKGTLVSLQVPETPSDAEHSAAAEPRGGD